MAFCAAIALHGCNRNRNGESPCGRYCGHASTIYNDLSYDIELDIDDYTFVWKFPPDLKFTVGRVGTYNDHECTLLVFSGEKVVDTSTFISRLVSNALIHDITSDEITIDAHFLGVRFMALKKYASKVQHPFGLYVSGENKIKFDFKSRTVSEITIDGFNYSRESDKSQIVYDIDSNGEFGTLDRQEETTGSGSVQNVYSTILFMFKYDSEMDSIHVYHIGEAKGEHLLEFQTHDLEQLKDACGK